MNENKRTGIPFYIAGVFILAVAFGLGFYFSGEKPLGSVMRGGEMHATSTANMSGTTYKAAEFNQLIQTAEYSSVTLGSIIIASTTANSMSIYNATSTDAIVNGDGTLITTMVSSTPQGTYTFDIALDEGLVVQLQAGFGGGYIITHR